MLKCLFLILISASLHSMDRNFSIWEIGPTDEEIKQANQEFLAKIIPRAQNIVATKQNPNIVIDEVTPLEALCESDEYCELKQQLLALGAKKDKLLHITARYLCLNTANLLLQNQANVNEQSRFENTAFHELCSYIPNVQNIVEKKVNLAKLFLKYKPRLDIKNTFGKTPLEVALSDHAPFSIALAKLLGSESRYRLLFETEAPRKHQRPSPLNRLPKDVIKKIILLVYPKIATHS